MSLETTDTVTPTITLENRPPVELPTGPFTTEVIFEDIEALAELGDRVPIDFPSALHVHDLN